MVYLNNIMDNKMNAQYLTTEQLADALQLKPQSIRVRVCRTGGYYCLKPVKMPNNRLMWPADSVAQLRGEA